MRSRDRDRTATRARELDYLLAEEKEERGERRGLEQRAAGLMAALLIAFPVSAAVAREADTSNGLAVAALGLLALVVIVAVSQASALTSALGEPKRERNIVRTARLRVADALGAGDLRTAVQEQRAIVETIRKDNGELVKNVRRVTVQLPLTLAGLLIALSLLVIAHHTSTHPAPVSRGPAIIPHVP